MDEKDKTTRRIDRATRRFLRATKKVSREQLKQAKQLVAQRPQLTLADALVEQGTLGREKADELVSQLRLANLNKQEREDRELAALLSVRDLVDGETLTQAREKAQRDVTAGSLATVLAAMNALPDEQLLGALEEVRQARRPKRRKQHGEAGGATATEEGARPSRPATHFAPGFDHVLWEGTAKGLSAFYFGAALVAIGLFFELAGIAGLLLVTGGFEQVAWQEALGDISSLVLESFLMALGILVVLIGLAGVILFLAGFARTTRAPDRRLQFLAVFGLFFFFAGIVATAVWAIEHIDELASVGGMSTVELTPTVWTAAGGSTIGLLMMILLLGRVEALYGNARLGDSSVVLAVLLVIFAGAGTFLMVQADPRTMVPVAAIVVMNAIVYIWMAILAKQARDSLRSEIAVARFHRGLPY